MTQPLSARQIWSMPILVGVTSAAGLLAALLGDGIWDVVSWTALGAPVAVIAWYTTNGMASLRTGKQG